MNQFSELRLNTPALGKPLGYVDQTTFPLPKLHNALRNISDEIHNHRGFKVLRGIPVSKHTREENIIIYAVFPLT